MRSLFKNIMHIRRTLVFEKCKYFRTDALFQTGINGKTVYLKSITLCKWLVICFLFLSRLFRNIEEFAAKKYFTDYRTANTIQLVVAIKGHFFWSILFLNKSQRRGISQKLVENCSHLFICISSK